MPHVPRLLKVVTLYAVTLALVDASAYAHGGAPPDLAFWGPFGRNTVRCLRNISLATRRCFDRVVTAKTECEERQFAGQTCNREALGADIAIAHATATAVVDSACAGGQLTELRFADFEDAKADVFRACVGEADAVFSLLYPDAIGDAPATCRTTASDLGRKLVKNTLVDSSRTLDRIGKRILPPSVRLALVAATRSRAAKAGEMCVQRLRRDCPTFDAIYGRSPEDWIEALTARSDCVAYATHFQTAVSCPFSVCGNGIKEPDEACDDGNRIDTDACRNNCTLNPSF
jgi:cysteine-rich repeat protein